MEFKIHKYNNPNKDKYPKDDIDIAYEFSKKVIKEFGSFIKTIAIFGSSARHDKNAHDIDILIVVDDITNIMTKEMVEAYRIIMQKIIMTTSKKLHITTLKMTNFWDYVRRGDPIGLNILRDGVALYDMSLFEPLRILVAQGRIMPSVETINIYVNKATGSLYNADNHIMRACLDLYWAAIDMAHAALMHQNVLPASPAHVADKLDEVFVKSNKLQKKYVTIMRKFYNLSKSIIHNEKHEITGKEYDQYLREARLFTDKMKKLIKRN